MLPGIFRFYPIDLYPMGVYRNGGSELCRTPSDVPRKETRSNGSMRNRAIEGNKMDHSKSPHHDHQHHAAPAVTEPEHHGGHMPVSPDRHQGHAIHGAADVVEQDHSQHQMPDPHAGHGGMAHDMSDPAMAAAMERDMKHRFFVALLLTLPTLLYSSLGRNLLNIDLRRPFAR